MPNICQEGDCKEKPNYNFPGEKKRGYCKNHKKAGMVDFRNRHCGEEGCTKTASYNLKGCKGGLYCADHRKDGMVDIKNKICLDCVLLATYNKKGEKQGLYCFNHKKDGMVNVIHKRCLFEGCDIFPGYNYEGKKSPLYCDTHKLDGMICIRRKTCQEDGCKTCPSYNIEGESPIYCVKHKKDGMIYVLKDLCKEDGCKITPIFNYENTKSGIYCFKHKKESMVDVKNHKNKCKEDECEITPHFNVPGKCGIYCSAHKKDGMIYITTTNNKCQEENCDRISYYNIDGNKKPIYCRLHRKDGMIDVKNKRCKTPLCGVYVTNKYEGYCVNCYSHLFPYRPITKRYKTKERTVTEFITKEFSDKTVLCDKRVVDGCSKRRPDMFLDLGDQVIIIEVDENQHVEYNCSCENKRIMELSRDVGHRPLVFIRFNPDEYLNKEGKKVTSCWGIGERGFCIIKRSKRTEWSKRLECLKLQVKYWINNKTDKTVEIVQLFYDEDVSN